MPYKRISAVYVFQNGMAMVFDENGEQIAELSGKWKEKEDEIMKAIDKETEVRLNCKWRS